ncbi:Uncharacterised protein [Mycolicibacterium flavescens]|nr:Uncharacterised protein [Mycolicibacterium flavescens]
MTPGDRLLGLAASSRSEFVMCAPFAKQSVVAKLLSVLPVGVEPVLYTRWRPEEVAAGVSDTEVLKVMRSRGGTVHLHDRLHAKYFRNDTSLLIGSANLTGAALGWAPNPNLELLVESRDGDVRELERLLEFECTYATDEIASEIERIAQLLPAPVELVEIPTSAATEMSWIPSLRIPSDLYIAYSRGPSSLASRSAASAASDLAALDLPLGLDESQFRTLVGYRLQSQPLFRSIDDFLHESRRFGEMREMISRLTGLDRGGAEEVWQTVMRWMLEFLPDRYTCDVYRRSEVMSRVGNAEGTGK